jgi:hypothetical protein
LHILSCGVLLRGVVCRHWQVFAGVCIVPGTHRSSQGGQQQQQQQQQRWTGSSRSSSSSGGGRQQQRRCFCKASAVQASCSTAEAQEGSYIVRRQQQAGHSRCSCSSCGSDQGNRHCSTGGSGSGNKCSRQRRQHGGGSGNLGAPSSNVCKADTASYAPTNHVRKAVAAATVPSDTALTLLVPTPLSCCVVPLFWCCLSLLSLCGHTLHYLYFIQLLGRADNLKDFIRRGADSGWVETTLSGGPGRPDKIIGCEMRKTAEGYSTNWRINGACGCDVGGRGE